MRKNLILLYLSVLFFQSIFGQENANSIKLDNIVASDYVVFKPKGQNRALIGISFNYQDSVRTNKRKLFKVVIFSPQGEADTMIYNDVSSFGMYEKVGRCNYTFPIFSSSETGDYKFIFQIEGDSKDISNQISVVIRVLDFKFINKLLSLFSKSATFINKGQLVIQEKNLMIKNQIFGNSKTQILAIIAEGKELKDFKVEKGKITLKNQIPSNQITILTNKGDIVYNVTAKKASLKIIGDNNEVVVNETINFKLLAPEIDYGKLTWKVNGFKGGNSLVGFIDSLGKYIAPKSPPPGSSVVISASTNVNSKEIVDNVQIRIKEQDTFYSSGTINQKAGGTLISTDGYGALNLKAGTLKAPIFFQSFSTHSVDSFNVSQIGINETIVRGYKIEARSNNEPQNLSATTKLVVQLPTELSPNERLNIYTIKNGKYVKLSEKLEVESDGIHGSGHIPIASLLNNGSGTIESQTYVLITRPISNLNVDTSFLTRRIKVSYPPSIPKIEEGMTLPVMLEAPTMIGQLDRISVEANGYENYFHILGPILKSNSAYGFTVKIDPIPNFNAGEVVGVKFLMLYKFSWPNTAPLPLPSPSTQSSWTISTEPNDFRVHGLPEMIVNPDRESNIYSIDGLRIDKVIEGTNRYSTLIVNSGATLGVGSVVDFIRADGITWDLRSVNSIENVLGPLTWNYDRQGRRINNNIKLFQPHNKISTIDVTGPVKIIGKMFLDGMTGGENPNGLSNPGRGLLGGIASGTLSGGVGGDGGKTIGDRTNDGKRGGNDSNLGYGRGPNGALANYQIPAGFGSRIDPIIINESSFFEDIANVVSTITFPIKLHELLTVKKDFFEKAKDAFETVEGGAKIVSPIFSTNYISNTIIAAGQGGNGGTLPQINMDTDNGILTGFGGGGGGGGGSFLKISKFFGFSIDRNSKDGGGGAGGGGAAGALRISSASKIQIDPTGLISLKGGRGGLGESTNSLGSSGGGGGAGTGGVLKLQSKIVDINGEINLSGGTPGGAFAPQNLIPLPESGRKIEVFNDIENNGMLISYGSTSSFLNLYRNVFDAPEAKLLWPTGRLRSLINFKYIKGIRALNTFNYNDEAEYGILSPLTKGMILIDENNTVWRTLLTSVYDSYVQVWLESPEFDLWPNRGIDKNFISTCIAVSPKYPYNIYVGGVLPTSMNSSGVEEGYTQIFELSSTGGFIKKIIDVKTRFTPGHVFLSDIDLLSNGDLIAKMGISLFKIKDGILTELKRYGDDMTKPSVTILRGYEKDIIYEASQNRIVGTEEERDPRYSIKKLGLQGNNSLESGTFAYIIETIGSPGDPGRLRVEGSTLTSKEPVIKYLETPLKGFAFPIGTSSSTFEKKAVVQSIAYPYNPNSENYRLVTKTESVPIYINGGEAMDKVNIVQTDGSRIVKNEIQLNSLGSFIYTAKLWKGFNTFWVETNPSVKVHEFLRQTILYLK